MAKSFKKLSLVCLLAVTALVGCGGNDNVPSSSASESKPSSVTSSKPTGERDIDYPREIPLLGEDSIQIHYQREDNKYKKWALWMWDNIVGVGFHYAFNYQDDYGVIASYPLSTFGTDPSSSKLGFIVKIGDNDTWSGKDVDDDRFIDFSNLEKDENGVYHVYIVSGDKNVYINSEKKEVEAITTCKFMYESSSNTYKIFAYANLPLSHYKITKNGNVIKEENLNGNKGVHAYFEAGEEPDITAKYEIEVTFAETGNKISASPSNNVLYQMKSFNDKYYYDGELGAIYTTNETTFKVWSPVSNRIVLRIYESGTPVSVDAERGNDSVLETVEMTKGEKGVFSATVSGDLEGKYYTYEVFNALNDGVEVVDPYAKSAGVNGLRGMIVDFSKTNPEGWNETNINDIPTTALTVYETHVADVTSSSSWNGSAENSKKYLGLIEEGTKYKNTISTGFDHIKELGVNAVQLLPIFDQANDEINVEFNWGYNPANYNVLEGSYSSNPYDGYARIREFKQVVQKYTQNGINIIMDVVYNHVNGVKGSNFDVLMPGYYFRYDGTGTLTNGSGCGNETASENKMVQKFILDSTEFLAREYKLGGFRFDLMGLHDVETMNKVSKNLKENVNQTISVYGEPWTGGTSGISHSVTPATQLNANSLVGVGQFNDQMRDALIKGGLSAASEKGWITSVGAPGSGDVDRVIAGLKGITAGTTQIKDPEKSVNYVTCHDNFTLYDRIKAAGINDEVTIRKMAMLANSVVFTAEGTTFMLAGEEMLRTKGGDSNSYKSSYEVNALDYSKLEEPEIMQMFENYKKLIEYKKSTGALHLNKQGVESAMNVESLDNGSMIKYSLSDTNADYIVIHTNGYNTTHTPVDLTGYSLMLDTTNTLSSNLGSVTPGLYQTIIAKKVK